MIAVPTDCLRNHTDQGEQNMLIIAEKRRINRLKYVKGIFVVQLFLLQLVQSRKQKGRLARAAGAAEQNSVVMPPVGNGIRLLSRAKLLAKIRDRLHNLPDFFDQQIHLRFMQQLPFIDSYALTNLVQIQHEMSFHSGPLEKFFVNIS